MKLRVNYYVEKDDDNLILFHDRKKMLSYLIEKNGSSFAVFDKNGYDITDKICDIIWRKHTPKSEKRKMRGVK